MNLKNIEIQQKINSFVEIVIFKSEASKDRLKKYNENLEKLTKESLIIGVHSTISRNPIKINMNESYLKKDFQKSFFEELKKHDKENNLTTAILNSDKNELLKFYKNPTQSAGTLQKYNNILQKYLFCIAYYDGNKIIIDDKLKEQAKRYIKNKTLDCPIDNYIFEKLKLFYNIDFKKENIVWSKLTTAKYNEIKNSIKECTSSLKNKLNLNLNNNEFYINKKSINEGLLFDLVYWERPVKYK